MENIDKLIDEYVKSLSSIEKKGLNIAKLQLESSFCIEKSIGFLKFLESSKSKN